MQLPSPFMEENKSKFTRKTCFTNSCTNMYVGIFSLHMHGCIFWFTYSYIHIDTYLYICTIHIYGMCMSPILKVLFFSTFELGISMMQQLTGLCQDRCIKMYGTWHWRSVDWKCFFKLRCSIHRVFFTQWPIYFWPSKKGLLGKNNSIEKVGALLESHIAKS